MCNDSQKINSLIKEKQINPFRGLCEATYTNDKIYSEFAKRKDLKWVKIQDLRLKYRWTDDETALMYNKTPDGWTDAFGVFRLYDFGKGENKIVKEEGDDKLFHEPQHDHIVSRDEAKKLGWSEKEINHPTNLQYISAVQNFMKRNFTLEMWKAVSPTISNLFQQK